LHFLQEFPGGKKTKFEKHKKWVGKGNKWLEKLNILGWEKPSAWRVEVRGVPHLAALLITDQLRHNPRILYPVRWIRGSHPFRDETAERMGHPNLWAE
jgi:hypothetical protein